MFSRSESSGTQTPLVDGLGSILALADASGAIQTTYMYEPFGRAVQSGMASANPSQYTGRDNDGTGLYFYRARYYSPAWQRFLSEDPIGLNGGQPKLYAYVSNNPVNYVDPLGLKMTPQECAALLKVMAAKAILLSEEIDDYNPITDGIGGARSPRKRGPAVPGGHYEHVKNTQRNLEKDVLKYEAECHDDPDDPTLPKCRELATRRLPLPVIEPKRNPILEFAAYVLALAAALAQLLQRVPIPE